ncbi:uncharacterized protein [Drosophila tropicalis]|uniref:uncharacterized protein n=1 Tax=Drosophila tropicalis TaxID=46794 RepID=UPI0035ABB348
MPKIATLKLSASYEMVKLEEDGQQGLQSGQPAVSLKCLLALDQLALQQQINANFIFHAISNYRKTPFERKTLEFIAKKWLQLQMLWREFRQRDKQIRRGYKDAEPQHGYFQQELYELVHEKYMEARGRLSRDKRNLLLNGKVGQVQDQDRAQAQSQNVY